MRNFVIAWVFVAAAALAMHLGGYPLLDPDEGRNGEVGREMAVTNDYVLPHIDGLPYLDKPIVYFASEGAVMEILGPTELAARLPAFLFTLLTAALIAWFARKVDIDPYVTTIVFLAMPLTMAFARTVIFDSALSFFVTAAIIAFYLEAPAIAWAAIAFGVLTKGPVAIALPLLVALPYAIWQKRFRSLWSWKGLLLFIVIIAPWIWGVQQAVPDFLHYVLVTETVQRLATKALKRTGPPWYFIPYLIGGAFPWSVAALFGGNPVVADATSVRTGFSRSRVRPAEAGPHTESPRRRSTSIFLLLWILVPFLFFSISQSKRPQYILPLMPAIALFVASRWNERMARAGAIAVAVFGALLVIAAPLVHLRAEFASQAREAAIVIGIAAIIGGGVALWRREYAVIALSVPILIIPLATNGVMQALATRRSEKALAMAIRPAVTPATEIVGIEAFTGSMAFYLERPIVVVSPDAEEFTSNYLIRHYAQFAGASNLRSTVSIGAVFDHSRPRIVIARDNDAKNRALIEANRGVRIAQSGHYVAYTIAR